MDGIKAELATATGSDRTVEVLGQLLGLRQGSAVSRPATSSKYKPVNTKPTAARSKRAAVSKSKPAQPCPVHQDKEAQLSGHDRYALATEIVNTCLKQLADLLKSRHRETSVSTGNDKAPSKERGARTKRPLQARSGNSTPLASPGKTIESPQKPSKDESSKSSPASKDHIIALAECAHLSFSFLRNADTKACGIRERPKYQLENGIIALASRLISHELYDLAARELSILQQCLEDNAASDSSENSGTMRDSPNLTRLMSLKRHVDSPLDDAAIPLAVSYYQQVLKLMSTSAIPRHWDAIFQAISIEDPNGYVASVERAAKISGDSSKAKKQLDSLSSTLLSACPSIASSVDGEAHDQEQFPSPETVLRLQTLAMRIRHRSLTKISESDAFGEETLQPVYKCATAFIRRSRADSKRQCEIVETCLEQIFHLSPEANGNEYFEIHQLLATLNESAGCYERAFDWATQMHHDCCGLDDNNARSVASIVTKATQLIQLSNADANAQECLSNAAKRLAERLSGGSGDYDLLLAALTQCLRALSQSSINSCGLPPLAAGFAQRYSRSYPGKSTQQVKSVIDRALSSSKSNDEIISWLTIDAVSVYVQCGTLKGVADTSRTAPLSAAWSMSTDSARLATILKTFILGALRHSPTSKKVSVFDNEDLCILQRGVLLECQLRFMLEVAPKRKYHSKLTTMLADVLQRLSKLYTPAEHPLRRARVACMVFAIRECHTDLVTPHDFRIWQDVFLTDSNSLGNDAGLENYRDEINVRLSVSRLFVEGRPSPEILQHTLVSLQGKLNLRTTGKSPVLAFDELELLTQQLRSITSYLMMLGEDTAAIPVQAMIIQCLHGQYNGVRQVAEAFTTLARTYLRHGHSSPAVNCLNLASDCLEMEGDRSIVHLELQLGWAELQLATKKLEQIDVTLAEWTKSCEGMAAKSLSQEERFRFQLIRFRAWLLRSQYCMQSGSPHDALAAAKNAVKGLNTFWQILEKDEGSPPTVLAVPSADMDDLNTAELTKGISKLNLTPEYRDDKHIRPRKSAAFWPLVPVLCQALVQLSDMYAHHGRYSEAKFLSDQAISIAESVGSAIWLSRVRSHRCRLLVLAGQTEDAELCLAVDEIPVDTGLSLHLIERLLAKSTMKAATGEAEAAAELFGQSIAMVHELKSQPDLIHIMANLVESTAGNVDRQHAPLVGPMSVEAQSSTQILATKSRANSYASSSTKASGVTAAKSRSRPTKEQPKTNQQSPQPSCTMAVESTAQTLFERMLMSQSPGYGMRTVLQRVVDELASRGQIFSPSLLQYENHLRKAMSQLEQDVTLNILAESTLATPAVRGQSHQPESRSAPSRSRTTTKRTASKAQPKTTKAKDTNNQQKDDKNMVTLFSIAHKCLADEQRSRARLCSTSQTHSDYSNLSEVSALQSAMSRPSGPTAFETIYQASLIEQPRIKALEYEEQAVLADRKDGKDSDILLWATGTSHEPAETMTPERFQAEYIDIIPKSWIAISLCLSEDCKDLCIARYRSGQMPLVLKQPFSRHKPDGIDDKAFDFAKGRAELQEIIDLCNYTAHHHGDVKSKGGSTKWWNERIALDKRLLELLINIERIWFGGFKSVFSRHVANTDALAQFRQSFDNILNKHLPSRQNAKGRSDVLQFDDKILELFLGLDVDDPSASLDDSLADLLYFVVDLLQFNGERNAYDEVDFDSMAIEVQDALQVYHDSASAQAQDNQHLILVLDRRLQAFPWESLPCLQDVSVSRVGSMLSLRESIVAMRNARRSTAVNQCSRLDDSYAVPRTSGTYVLNPSSNLPGTQTKLQPSLSTLEKATGASWNSVVGNAPTEEAYSSALRSSSMFLYFGHGSGSQYIRPRTIKQLDRCSEVVWLMGCSSSKISEYGQLEAAAVPLAYLLAGGSKQSSGEGQHDNKRCLAVVGCLWDVTDKDIDRFSLALGEQWGLWPAVEREKFPKVPAVKSNNSEPPVTPEQVPKTPKTPKVRKTLPDFETPARRRALVSQDGSKCSLVEAVNRSRDACYLRYLNGAAPVVYGVPVYLAE